MGKSPTNTELMPSISLKGGSKRRTTGWRVVLVVCRVRLFLDDRASSAVNTYLQRVKLSSLPYDVHVLSRSIPSSTKQESSPRLTPALSPPSPSRLQGCWPWPVGSTRVIDHPTGLTELNLFRLLPSFGRTVNFSKCVSVSTAIPHILTRYVYPLNLYQLDGLQLPDCR